MITENHELLTARFTDSERNTIEALWIDPKTKEISEEAIQAKAGDASFDYLLKFVTLEEIHSNTHTELKLQRETFLNDVKLIAEEEGLIYSGNTDSLINRLNKLLFDENINKETVFKIKLLAFELPFVKQYKGRPLKTKLRKAENILDVYRVLFEIKLLAGEQDVSDGSENSEGDQEVSE